MPTLSGKWKFNDVLETTYSATADIHFTVNGYNTEYGVDVVAYFERINNGYITADDIEMSYSFVSSSPDFGIDSGSHIVYSDTGYDDGWRSDQWQIDLQTITITEPTEVSDEFYEWFIANASPVVTKTLSGTWKFNDVLTAPSTNIDRQSVSCEIVGNFGFEAVGECSEIYFFMGDLYFTVDKITPSIEGFPTPLGANVYTFSSNTWNAIIQTVTFTSEQEVSAEFYEWFTANATVYTPEVPTKTLSGTWKFNDVLIAPNGEIATDGLAFVSNGVTYDVISSAVVDGYTGMIMGYAYGDNPDLGDGSSIIAYITEGIKTAYEGILGLALSEGWQSEEHKIITFTSEQEVSDEFYEWFTANATTASETGTVDITYNGSQVCSLTSGQSATFYCAGEVMGGDFIVSLNADATMIYDGTNTALTSGQVVTIPCAGKVMRTDLVITA